MKVYSLPKDLRTIIFDIDSTLYTNAAYAHEQVDIQIRAFAKLRGISDAEARAMVHEYRHSWSLSHNGEKLSLGNTLKAFGIPISQSIIWRNELLEPSMFLKTDTLLYDELLTLHRNYSLICVTNNPVLPARKTLEALGVSGLIPDIIGLDTCGVSKPHEKPFLLAAEKTKTPVTSCLSIGDRYDIDIALPVKLGMGGILVNGVEEVYQLDSLLKKIEIKTDKYNKL